MREGRSDRPEENAVHDCLGDPPSQTDANERKKGCVNQRHEVFPLWSPRGGDGPLVLYTPPRHRHPWCLIQPYYKSKAVSTGVTVFLEGLNSRRLIPLRAEICSCLLGGVFSEPGDF